jgi:hypothetical protein
MKSTKQQRRHAEMARGLSKQIRLLEHFVEQAKTDSDFLAEIANKLRLLLVEGRANRALLLEVAQAYKTDISFEPRPSRQLPRTWKQLLDEKMGGAGGMRFRELICRWTEQWGGAHEDWAIDEMLVKLQAPRAHSHRIPHAEGYLLTVARSVIECSRLLLEAIRSVERI